MIIIFEEFDSKKWREELPSRIRSMKDLDKKNVDMQTMVTEEDPYGEEQWDINKDDLIKENLYKVLTNRTGDFGQKPIYDVFIKCNSGNYYLIGDIRYFRKLEDKRTKEEKIKDDEESLKHMLEFLPRDQHYAYREYQKKFIEKRDKGEITHTPFIVYFYGDLKKKRLATPDETQKMEQMTKDEIDYLFEKELRQHIYSGDLRTDIRSELTYVDQIYHFIKDN